MLETSLKANVMGKILTVNNHDTEKFPHRLRGVSASAELQFSFRSGLAAGGLLLAHLPSSLPFSPLFGGEQILRCAAARK
jgi:hypothetical protein